MSKPRKIQPAPGQTTIDQQMAKEKRGRQLMERRIARFGSIYHRMLIWLLDDHIGSKETYDLTFADLAWGTEMSESKVYQVAGELRDQGLIDFEETAPNSAKYTFRLCRSNIAELAEGSEQVTSRRRGRPKKEANKKSSTARKTFRDVENLPQHGKPFHGVENPSMVWKTFPQHGNAPYIERQRTPTTPPTSASESPDGWEELERELMREGMIETDTPLDRLREHGCTPQHAQEILAFFRKFPGHWEIGHLRRRLIQLRPWQSAEDLQLWPPPKDRVETQSSDWERLRSLSGSEIHALIAWAFDRSANDQQRAAWAEIRGDPGWQAQGVTDQTPALVRKYKDQLLAALRKRDLCKQQEPSQA